MKNRRRSSQQKAARPEEANRTAVALPVWATRLCHLVSGRVSAAQAAFVIPVVLALEVPLMDRGALFGARDGIGHHVHADLRDDVAALFDDAAFEPIHASSLYQSHIVLQISCKKRREITKNA